MPLLPFRFFRRATGLICRASELTKLDDPNRARQDEYTALIRFSGPAIKPGIFLCGEFARRRTATLESHGLCLWEKNRNYPTRTRD